jgi:PilZ domain
MRRLKNQQQVEIHLDGEDEIIVPCRVVRVEGSVATLESAEGDPVLPGNTAPALPGYLVFEHAGRQVALKGIAAPDANEVTELLFVVIDGVQLPERRSAERVEIDAYARLFLPVAVADREYVDTPLADLSVSGMRVERHPSLDVEPCYRLELYIGAESTPIRCDAEVARTTATHVGMKFVGLADADRAILAAIVASRQSRVHA